MQDCKFTDFFLIFEVVLDLLIYLANYTHAFRLVFLTFWDLTVISHISIPIRWKGLVIKKPRYLDKSLWSILRNYYYVLRVNTCSQGFLSSWSGTSHYRTVFGVGGGGVETSRVEISTWEFQAMHCLNIDAVSRLCQWSQVKSSEAAGNFIRRV